MMHRHEIEGRPASAIAGKLRAAYTAHCTEVQAEAV
jgi:hypothetical protein